MPERFSSTGVTGTRGVLEIIIYILLIKHCKCLVLCWYGTTMTTLFFYINVYFVKYSLTTNVAEWFWNRFTVACIMYHHCCDKYIFILFDTLVIRRLCVRNPLSFTAPPAVQIVHSGHTCNVEEERYSERVYTIREGETLELTCLVSGHPRPQVSHERVGSQHSTALHHKTFVIIGLLCFL